MTSIRAQHSGAAASISLRRRTIEEALVRAAQGLPPLQPHNDIELLKAEAAVALDYFMHHIKPALKAILRAPQYNVGPAKDTSRVLQKKGHVAENCDFARCRNLANNMQMVEKATDMFSRRGLLTLRGSGNSEIRVYIVDAENTFTNPNHEKKPGLRNIDSKLMISLTLTSGEMTYHVLEMHTILAASADAYEQSHKAYEEHRRQKSLVQTFSRAASESTKDQDAVMRFGWEMARAQASANVALTERTRINMEDQRLNNTGILTGYVPKTNAGNGWKFTSFDDLARMYDEAPPPAAAPMAHYA